jgi:hypothetical protein
VGVQIGEAMNKAFPDKKSPPVAAAAGSARIAGPTGPS